MANKFAKGDVVKMKSGGPPMTVDLVPGEVPEATIGKPKPRTTYLTRWFKGASAESGQYAEHLLELYVPPVKK